MKNSRCHKLVNRDGKSDKHRKIYVYIWRRHFPFVLVKALSGNRCHVLMGIQKRALGISCDFLYKDETIMVRCASGKKRGKYPSFLFLGISFSYQFPFLVTSNQKPESKRTCWCVHCGHNTEQGRHGKQTKHPFLSETILTS